MGAVGVGKDWLDMRADLLGDVGIMFGVFGLVHLGGEPGEVQGCAVADQRGHQEVSRHLDGIIENESDRPPRRRGAHQLCGRIDLRHGKSQLQSLIHGASAHLAAQQRFGITTASEHVGERDDFKLVVAGRAEPPVTIHVGQWIVGAGKEHRCAVHIDMIGDGMGGYDHLPAQILGLRTVLLFQNQLEVPETVLARNQAAGKIHGEVLDPDRRITTRRDGQEPQSVGFAVRDAPRSHPAAFEGSRRQLADQRQFVRQQNLGRGRPIGNGIGSR